MAIKGTYWPPYTAACEKRQMDVDLYRKPHSGLTSSSTLTRAALGLACLAEALRLKLLPPIVVLRRRTDRLRTLLIRQRGRRNALPSIAPSLSRTSAVSLSLQGSVALLPG
jgi:hypothetical protein